MTTTTAAPTVMERLRDETMEHHKRAESHPLQKALATGQLSREHYTGFHGQLMLVHRALERALAAKAATVPAIARSVKLYMLTEQYHAADLAHFGIDPAGVRPTPATARVIEHIQTTAASNPIALLGMLYVLEGSKNGSKFLSRVVMKAYGIGPGPGVLAMDPYGDHQRAYWQQFKDDMNGLAFTPEQIDGMLTSAKAMFDAIGAIGSDIMPG